MWPTPSSRHLFQSRFNLESLVSCVHQHCVRTYVRTYVRTSLGSGVWGLGTGVWGLGSEDSGLGFGVRISGRHIGKSRGWNKGAEEVSPHCKI